METLDQLNAFSSRSLEVWLETRLRAQYSPDSLIRYEACDFRSLGIPFGESHLDQLLALFRKLSIEAQDRFRGATRSLFRHAQPGDFPFEAMADIVLLTGLINGHDVLKDFVPVLGSGPWGESHPSLIYDALSVLLMFPAAIEAYDAARGLVTSTNFPDAYVFDGYLILVRCRPDRWFADLEALRDRFFRLQERIRVSGNRAQIGRLARRERDFVECLVQAVPLSELASQLPNLWLVPPHARDAWLVKQLFESTTVLKLEFARDGRSLRLISGADPARHVSVPESAAFEVFCIDRGHLVDDLVTREASSRLTPRSLALLENSSRSLRYHADSGI